MVAKLLYTVSSPKFVATPFVIEKMFDVYLIYVIGSLFPFLLNFSVWVRYGDSRMR